MNPSRWAKISEIVETALGKDKTERSAYLTQVCGEDTALRQEVESLLSFDNGDHPDVFEKNQVNAFLFSEDGVSQYFVGKEIGKYKTIKLLGEGGMGAVFFAERTDGEFEQQVAIKLLKQGFISKNALNRFISERQILARLHHRFIAHLIDGGTTDEGLPFLVMEYIEGAPLLDYCDQHYLDLKARLEIFQKICSAVQYAHQHLVIHRDLKPSNILALEHGELKLLDFGISKLVSPESDAMRTQTEFRALTPGYASPEQVRGEDVSITTDVYSLGVILYELLTGKRPYNTDSKNFSEIVRAICEVEPMQPSDAITRQIVGAQKEGVKGGKEGRGNIIVASRVAMPAPRVSASQLKGDLDNIILTALRKEPNRRYRSAQDLSDDISNYLNGLPVRARPNTFFYRASKFYARNKTASIVGAFFILSLVAGIITTTWQSVVAGRQRDRAEKRFQDVRRLSSSLLFEITPKIERLPGSTEAREIVVTRALEYLDSLSVESQNDLSLQSELASAYESVGDVQGNPGKPNLGDLEGGIESYQKAQAIRQLLAEKDPDDFEAQRRLAANYNSVGDFRWWTSDVEGALADYEKAVGIFEKLAVQRTDDLQINVDHLGSILNKIKVISYNGLYDESLRQYGEMLQKVQNLEERFPQNVELQRIKAHSLIRTAYDLSWQDRYELLGDYVKRSFAIYEPMLAANSNDARIRRDVYFAYFQAGGIYIENDPRLSREYLEKAAEIAKNTVAQDQLNYLAKHDLAQSNSKLGELSAVEKKYPAAVDYLSKAETILSDLTRAEPKHEGYKYSLANNYARLAAAQEGAGNFPRAIENYEKAIAKHEELYRGDTKNNMGVRAIAVAEQDLGRVYEKLKQPQKALDFYRKSVETFALLEQKGALGDYDKKIFENSKKAVEKSVK